MSSFRLTSFSNSVDTCVFIRTEGSGSGSSYCLNNAVANTSDNVNSGDCDRLPAFQPFSKGLWWHPGVSGPWGPVSVSPTPLVETLGQAGWDKIPTLTENFSGISPYGYWQGHKYVIRSPIRSQLT